MPAAGNQRLKRNQVSRVNSYVTDWVNALEPFLKNDDPYISVQNPRNEDVIKSDVDKLCEALGEVMKNVTKTQLPSTMKPNSLFERHFIEKDSPIFDGKSEEWPTFKSHFPEISSMAEYTQEEPDQIIDTILNKLKTFCSIRENYKENLIQFASHVNSLVSTIKSSRQVAHLQNTTLLRIMVQKLPDMLKLRWEEEVMGKNGAVNIEDFSKWLMQIANAACFVKTPRTSNVRTPNFRNNGKLEGTLVISPKENDVCIAVVMDKN
ncbi:hypothetical protein JTB14_031535 [Gonioctena quinquepunctata]|nr:hypothetical protein JTB14_031535 [Gonioctena quinquepunctata]